MRRSLAFLLPLTAGLALGACSDRYGYGGGIAVGIGSPGYFGGDYFGYYSDYPYWGWYNGFYYPGSGTYVYDRYRRPHSWEPYRQYWTERRTHWQNNPQWQHRQQGFRTNWDAFRQNRPTGIGSGRRGSAPGVIGGGRRGGPGAVSGGRHGRRG